MLCPGPHRAAPQHPQLHPRGYSMTESTPRFGAHLSVAGGLHCALTAAATVGCDCVQIFVRNQRQWQAPPLSAEAAQLFEVTQRDTGVQPVIAHSSYLINLASPDPQTRKRSSAALRDEYRRCGKLGVAGLVVHPGAHLDDTLETGIKRIVKGLNRVLRACHAVDTSILLETTAGQGSSIGHRFEHLAAIRAGLDEPARVGLCLDTCHLFTAGFDFRTAAGYERMMAELDDLVGLGYVRCIHTNDSKRELGSRVDRHEHIGKGRIGKDGFAHFVNDPRFAGIPMILETPKGEDGRGTDLDRVNLKRLRSLLTR